MKKTTAKKTTLRPTSELGELIELQKESISIQKDIRALLLSLTALKDGELNSRENLNDRAGPRLFLARMLDQTSQLGAESINKQLNTGLLRAAECDKQLEASINAFWNDYLHGKGRTQSAVDLIKERSLSFRDFISLAGEFHGYPKNVTRCGSEIETKIRKHIKENPDDEKYFDEFFAEAKKKRCAFARVPITLDQMSVILEIMNLGDRRLKYIELALLGKRVPIYSKWE